MFDNVIAQSAVTRIIHDLEQSVFPPSVLFAGPEAQAKGTAALELARVLSCEAAPAVQRSQTALWNCTCPSCAHHRNLSHPDLMVLGPRPFRAEIAACSSAFLKEPENTAAKMLFLRAVRKLLLRFSPVLHEGDPKVSKFNKLLETITDNLEEITANLQDQKKLEKNCAKIIDNCIELEAEGISNTIPVSQIRHSAYWLRMAPNGRRKTLVIENAEKMNDAARNSLLKILEEPPDTAAIILTTTKPKALLPTILSRLRQYHFIRRGVEHETAVLKRIFRKEINTDETVTHANPCTAHNPILVYLDSFLPASNETLYPLAAYFWSSIAASAIFFTRKTGAALLSETLIVIGKHCAPIAENSGLRKHDTDIKTMTSFVTKTALQFEPRSLFLLFIGLLYHLLSESAGNSCTAGMLACRSLLKTHAEEARLAVETFNQSPVLALERLAFELRTGLVKLNGGAG